MKVTYYSVYILLALSVIQPSWARGSSYGGFSHSYRTSGPSLRGLGAYPVGKPSEHYTRSYMRRDGASVPGHYATNPNHTKLDNWTTRGNVNPHTGKEGTRSPY